LCHKVLDELFRGETAQDNLGEECCAPFAPSTNTGKKALVNKEIYHMVFAALNGKMMDRLLMQSTVAECTSREQCQKMACCQEVDCGDFEGREWDAG
jgi:hypothetical protein